MQVIGTEVADAWTLSNRTITSTGAVFTGPADPTACGRNGGGPGAARPGSARWACVRTSFTTPTATSGHCNGPRPASSSALAGTARRAVLLVDPPPAQLSRTTARSPVRACAGAQAASGRLTERPQRARAQIRDGEPGVDQDLRHQPVALAQQAEQEVLAADAVVVQVDRRTQGELQDLLRARDERQTARVRLGAGGSARSRRTMSRRTSGRSSQFARREGRS